MLIAINMKKLKGMWFEDALGHKISSNPGFLQQLRGKTMRLYGMEVSL